MRTWFAGPSPSLSDPRVTNRHMFTAGCVALGLLALLPLAAGAQGRAFDDEPVSVPGEVLIQFRVGVTADAQAIARARVGAMHDDLLVAAGRRDDGKGDLELARLPPGIALQAAIRQLAADPAVEFAEPNWIYHHMATSTDPYYTNGSLWGMYGDATVPTNPYGSQAGEAWAAGNTGNAGVVVAVIDEGIMVGHEDLSANLWVNPGEIAGNGNGIDDDGNGKIDDINGWDFVGNDNTTFDGGNGDKHGTHVAGTIGAAGNGKGVAGVNWTIKLISAKFLGKNGGTLANAILAVDYITDLKRDRGITGIVATNNSWGGGGFSQALLDAINRGGNADILFIAAAGNGGRDGVGDNNDTTSSYPSNYQCNNGGGRAWDCVIAVAAIGSSGARASFSNYGATTVDLGAPGVSILSTLPGKAGSSTYGSYSGTSMATPHVSGAAALFAARTLTNSGSLPSARAIRDAITGATIPTASLAGRTVTGGRLNVGGF